MWNQLADIRNTLHGNASQTKQVHRPKLVTHKLDDLEAISRIHYSSEPKKKDITASLTTTASRQ
jgi:hypothetical protein